MWATDAKVVAVAAISRILWLLIAGIADWLLRDYDTSAHLNERPCGVDDVPENASKALLFADVWDTVYFERVSRCGYEFEHYMAFFPGMPLLMSLLGSNGTTTVCCGLLISTVAFCLSAVLMYRTGKQVLRDEFKAALAVLIMCLSPASVFLTMAYTEAIFQALTFLGVWLLINCNAPLLSALPFAASCAVRSNGIINAGFLLYHCLESVGHAAAGRLSWARASSACMRASAGLFVMAAVLAAVLQRGYTQFCTTAAWQEVPEPRPYCVQGGPSLYSFIQGQYWGVGFLKYYRADQIPNFLLAAPTLLFGAAAVVSYVHRDVLRAATLGRLGPARLQARMSLLLERILPAYAPPESTDRNAAARSARSKRRPSLKSGFYADAGFVFVVQLAAMLLIAAVFMHIQVVTRFVTTCLALYWYMAEVLTRKQGIQGKLVLVHCTVWAWAGLVLFPNFYPWT
eukprot:jgi/Ulvmu1/932/UM102_0015.1